MKKVILIISIIIILISCADKKTINGTTYRPYGIFNENTAKNDNVEYEVSGWAVFSGILFFETIAVPIYTFGFNLWQPVRLKSQNNYSTNGIISEQQPKDSTEYQKFNNK